MNADYFWVECRATGSSFLSHTAVCGASSETIYLSPPSLFPQIEPVPGPRSAYSMPVLTCHYLFRLEKRRKFWEIVENECGRAWFFILHHPTLVAPSSCFQFPLSKLHWIWLSTEECLIDQLIMKYSCESIWLEHARWGVAYNSVECSVG